MSDSPECQFALRPLEKPDLAELSCWFQDVADLACFDRSARTPLNSAATEHAWEASADAAGGTGKCWFSIVADTGALAGIAGLEGISAVNRDAVIALFIAKERRRQGIGIRAMALMLDFAFRQLGLNRVTSYYREDNLRTRDMTAQLGFETEGRLRRAWYAEGCFFDMVAVGILRAEWDRRRQELSQSLKPGLTVSFGAADAQGWVWPPRQPEGATG